MSFWVKLRDYLLYPHLLAIFPPTSDAVISVPNYKLIARENEILVLHYYMTTQYYTHYDGWMEMRVIIMVI